MNRIGARRASTDLKRFGLKWFAVEDSRVVPWYRGLDWRALSWGAVERRAVSCVVPFCDVVEM